MSIQKLIVASAATLVVATVWTAPAWSNDSEARKGAPIARQQEGKCEARIVRAQTQYPKAAQERGDGGVVRVQVVLDEAGKVQRSSVVDSSGSYLLDRAAEKSVGTQWQFDVSHCIASAIPVTQEVNVVYRRVPKSMSGSVSVRGLKQARLAAANDQCSVEPTDSRNHIISCIERATPGGIAASGLATR
jgi:TonB family protein